VPQAAAAWEAELEVERERRTWGQRRGEPGLWELWAR